MGTRNPTEDYDPHKRSIKRRVRKTIAMPDKKNTTGDEHKPLDYDRGGHNPLPAKSKKRVQVGPTPTSGSPDKSTPSAGKKIREQGTKQD
jgi:hypothetical protein